MRGLKLLSITCRYTFICRIFYRCVDWNHSRRGSHDRARKSHLLQMRGLKPKNEYGYETLRSRIFYRCVDWNLLLCLTLISVIVASFTDAWIETLSVYEDEKMKKSHLLQMRGLKQIGTAQMIMKEQSHLLQMRGLKPYKLMDKALEQASHLLQMRGLKPIQAVARRTHLVASFTDAWIETD